MTATDGGKDDISVDFDWFSLMTGDPHRCTAFLENVKVLNFVQPLRMYAIYIYNRTEMPKNHILTFVVWKPLFVFLLYSRFGVSRYL